MASLVFFRIAFGILAIVDIAGTWGYYHLKKNAFDPDGFQFSYYGFEWIKPWPEPFMSIFFLGLILAGVGVVFGRWYRFCSICLALGFTYTFLLEKSNYLNHGYLFCWLSFLMILLPADRQFSWSVWRTPGRRWEQMPFWCLFVLRFLIGIVYFFGGLAKINADWLRGVPLIDWMEYKSSLPLIGPVLGLSWTPYFMAYVGLLLDLTIVLFLLIPRTRPWAFGLAICFHLLNMLIFNIGIFPYLSISLTALYFPPDFPRKIMGWLASRSALISRGQEAWRRRMQVSSAFVYTLPTPRYQAGFSFVMALLMVFHLMVPLRHYLFPGPVAWTEEGHRYSWRMMLRAKQGRGNFRIVDENGVSQTVQPQTYLSSRQTGKLYTHPDMILQFAHYLHDTYAKQGKTVQVFADIEVRLNDRSYQLFIDPSVDLAQEQWHFFRHSDWIVPLSL